jgi:hypothetical protein
MIFWIVYPCSSINTYHRFGQTCQTHREDKIFPLQAQVGPWGSRRLRLPDFLDFRHYEGGKVVTPMHRPPLPSGVFLVLIFRVNRIDCLENGNVMFNPHKAVPIYQTE